MAYLHNQGITADGGHTVLPNTRIKRARAGAASLALLGRLLILGAAGSLTAIAYAAILLWLLGSSLGWVAAAIAGVVGASLGAACALVLGVRR